MASLTITVGPLTSKIDADNTKANALLTQYAAAIGADGTNQEKLDAVVRSLVAHMRYEGRRHRHNRAAVDAAAAIQAEIDGLDWSA